MKTTDEMLEEKKVIKVAESSTSRFFWDRVQHVEKSLHDAEKFFHRVQSGVSGAHPKDINSKDGQELLDHVLRTGSAIHKALQMVKQLESEYDALIDRMM